MRHTRLYTLMIAGMAAMSAIMVSCGGGDDATSTDPVTPVTPDPTPTPTPTPSSTDYSQQYRPQIHYSPKQYWINDPNGMVYVDGTWHLFYQYNPYSNDWGNMSWGHATSTDLVHWTEQSVALTKSTIGDIFSGSCVIDKDNTAGFGAGAMVAIYTGNGDHQQQGIAYSTDGGKTFTQYSANPVIPNTDKSDFRDPKVFWYETASSNTQQPTDSNKGQWIMSLARGYSYAIDFYTSKDLKNWTYLSSFTSNVARVNNGQWECPDLFPLTCNGQQKWILIVSVNPGGPTLGSGTMYFIGDFDGKTFTADNLDYPLWLDYGMDNYAGVTWANAADRRILIGWMNNWQYAASVPCTPWRSAMTLPRELSLVDYNGTPLLASKVVSEVDALAGSWTDINNGAPLATAKAYQLQVTLSTRSDQTVTLANSSNQQLQLELNASSKKLVAHRNSSTGIISFSSTFSLPAVQAPLNTDKDEIVLNIYVDQSSVEVFSDDGTIAMTNLVFPTSIYNTCTTTGSAKVRTLKSIW